MHLNLETERDTMFSTNERETDNGEWRGKEEERWVKEEYVVRGGGRSLILGGFGRWVSLGRGKQGVKERFSLALCHVHERWPTSSLLNGLN